MFKPLPLSALVAVLLGSSLAEARPTDKQLAPIVIPPGVSAKSNFASALNDVCVQLEPEPVPAQQVSAFDPKVVVSKDDVAGMIVTCSAVRGDRPFTQQDIDNLKAFKSQPDPSALANRILRAAGSGASAAGQTSLADTAGAVLGTVVNGVAKFIYDRAKAEAGLYLSAQLKKQLCSDERRPFFPSLCLAFDGVDVGISLSAMGSYLAAAAERDLRRLPDTSLVYAGNAVARGSAPDDRKAALESAIFGARISLAYYREVAAGRAPLEVAVGLRHVKLADNPAPDTFAMVQLSSQMLDAIARQTGWNAVNAGTTGVQLRCYALGAALSLDAIRKEDANAAAAAGMPYPFGTNPVVTPAILTRLLEHLPSMVDDLGTIEQRLADAQRTLTAPLPANEGGMPVPNTATASAPTTGAAAARDYVALTASFLGHLAADADTLAQDVGFVGGGKDSAAGAVTVSEFGQAIVSRSSVTDTALAAVALLDRLDRQLSDVLPNGTPGITEVERIIPLVTQLAQAKSADEAAAVIQAAAAPVTEYQLKSKRLFVAINALAGIAAGSEGVDIGTRRWSGFIEPFAPIGVHATVPTCFGSIGGFISIANLGTVVAARFRNDTQTASNGTTTEVSATPAVNALNLLSPGIFLTLGLGDSPFVVGGGAQVIPARQVIKTAPNDTTTDTTVPAVQVLGFASVDVPIFEL